MPKLIPLLCALALVSLSVAATESASPSKYAGQQTRAIKGLSPEDIAELRRGGGWGLALAAELNGLPGPAHLLELSDQIPLTQEQVVQLTELYENMRDRAIIAGASLIENERELDQQFKTGTIDDARLREQLRKIAESRMNLRYIHLSTHLRTPKILGQAQIARYNELRGYTTDDDPCSKVPAGHNATMWRKHHGCE